MKVYFINLPFEGQDERAIQSLGAAYLAAELIMQNIDVYIYDGCGVDREKNTEELYKELLCRKPEYIGFYVIEHNYKVTMEFLNHLSSEMKAVFFLGGPQVSFCADEIMAQEKNVDFILVGESEGKIGRIIKGDFSVNGLLYRKNNMIIKNVLDCDNQNLDNLIFPVRTVHGKCLLTREIYGGKEYYVVPISSSRGCPYNCSFCAVPTLVKGQNIQWRCRSSKNIEREIRDIYGIYKDIYIRFIDDNFLVDIDRAIDICKRIKKVGYIPFSFAGRVDSILRLNDAQIKTLKNCGMTAVEVGVENFNDHVLQRYRKGNTANQTKKALKKLIDNDIYPGIDFIMFDPWTTVQELKNNYKAIVELGLDSYTPPFLANRLYPFPGTEYYSNGLINMNQYFLYQEVDKIYQNMINFMERYRQYKLYIQKHKVRNYVVQIFIRLPYKVFAYLLNEPSISIENIEMIKSFERILLTCPEKERELKD